MRNTGFVCHFKQRRPHWSRWNWLIFVEHRLNHHRREQDRRRRGKSRKAAGPYPPCFARTANERIDTEEKQPAQYARNRDANRILCEEIRQWLVRPAIGSFKTPLLINAPGQADHRRNDKESNTDCPCPQCPAAILQFRRQAVEQARTHNNPRNNCCDNQPRQQHPMRGDSIAFGLLQRLWPQTVNITRSLCRWIKCHRSSLRYAVLAISHSMDMQPHLADGRYMGVYG